MFERIKKWRERQLLIQRQRQFTEMATRALYGGEPWEFEEIVSQLAEGREGVDLMRAYVAVETASRLKEPLSDADVEAECALLQSVSSPTKGPARPERSW